MINTEKAPLSDLSLKVLYKGDFSEYNRKQKVKNIFIKIKRKLKVRVGVVL